MREAEQSYAPKSKGWVFFFTRRVFIFTLLVHGCLLLPLGWVFIFTLVGVYFYPCQGVNFYPQGVYFYPWGIYSYPQVVYFYPWVLFVTLWVFNCTPRVFIFTLPVLSLAARPRPGSGRGGGCWCVVGAVWEALCGLGCVLLCGRRCVGGAVCCFHIFEGV